MEGNFEASLKHVLVHEGGYGDHPEDPGGATNKGITLATFRRHFGADRSKADLRAISDEQVRTVYRKGYWNACRCDDLPAGVDYVVFDQAVNSGPGRSVKWLQKAVGATVDGAIGPKTVAAAGQKDADEVVDAMCDARLAFLKTLDHWDTFGKGWSNRVKGVRARGLSMAAGDEAPSAAPAADFEVVRRGSKGAWVEKLQRALGISVDGDFGPGTERALKAFQASAGLHADGVAGRVTYRALGLVP